MRLFKNSITYLTAFTFMLCFNVKAQDISIKDSTNVQGEKIDSTFKFLKSIPGNFTYLDVDVLGNIYLITDKNQLKKIRPNGDSLAVFNDVKKFGNPTLLDVTNPLKILLYIKTSLPLLCLIGF